MDTIGETTKIGAKILTWFSDYGALQILAMFGLLWPVVIVCCLVWMIKTIGRPLSTIADWLEEHSEKKP